MMSYPSKYDVIFLILSYDIAYITLFLWYHLSLSFIPPSSLAEYKFILNSRKELISEFLSFTQNRKLILHPRRLGSTFQIVIEELLQTDT